MNQLLTYKFFTPMVILILIIGCLPVLGQIDVTINFNSSTNRDTLMEHHIVQLRGSATGDVAPPIAWEDTSQVFLENWGLKG